MRIYAASSPDMFHCLMCYHTSRVLKERMVETSQSAKKKGGGEGGITDKIDGGVY